MPRTELFAVQMCLSMLTRDLAVLAAAQEPEAHQWQQRFTDLIASGLLSLPAPPGGEFAFAVSPALHRQAAPALLAWMRRFLRQSMGNGVRTSLDISAVPTADWPEWSEAIRGYIREVGPAAGQLSCSLILPPDYSWRDLPDVGDLPLILRYGIGTVEQAAKISYRRPQVVPVPKATVRPVTALHAAEQGQAVMPDGLFEVRSNTAWLLVDLDMRMLCGAAETRSRLGWCLRFADNLIDATDWSLPALRLDALLNRRVAIRLTHVGDVMQSRRLHPERAQSFVWLQRHLQFIRHCFVHESMLLARRRGPFPQLCAGDLVAALTPRYGVADARRLLRNRMLRHRHLLALSPASLWPVVSDCREGAWLNLLPAIACADAITLSGPDLRMRLTACEWRRLLQLTAAVAAGGVRRGPVVSYALS